jgi:UPF0755 protein
VGKLLLFIVLIAAAVSAWLWYSINCPYQGFSTEGVFVEVPHGSSSRSVGRLLERKGVVRSSVAFELYARRHSHRSPQAGEYFFDRATSAHDVFWKLANGQVFEQPFTVREGETMFDIARDLEAGKFMPATDFLRAAKDPALVHDIAPQAATLEGFLFPATYHLSRHPSATALTTDMVRKFKEEWTAVSTATTGDKMTTSGAFTEAASTDSSAAASNAAPSTRPVAAVVTLASLVERETPKAEERPLVAGVFENRLHKNMLLQCDPTVIYALEQQGRYNGTLSTADLHIDSPYNSYTHTGLPPGPIGNPGEASLRAAYQPAHTNYLYFVANTQGGHFFSATLAEHNNNVIKYRRLLAGEQASNR